MSTAVESQAQKEPRATAVIGRKIRLLRVFRDIRQQELAFAVGITASHLSKIEAGKHYPHDSTLELLAKELRVTVEDLRR